MAGSNFLDRFRPVGAPGPGAPVGVPASDIPGANAELAPIFAALSDDAHTGRSIVDAARTEADRTLTQARERASGIIAQARMDSGSEQASAAALVLGEAADRDRLMLEDSTRRGADLQRSARSRLPQVVATIIDTLVAERMADG